MVLIYMKNLLVLIKEFDSSEAPATYNRDLQTHEFTCAVTEA